MVFALLTPFVAFWVPESLGGSGVLATVVCGLYVSWNGPRFISPATRLQGFFVWDLVIYLIEGLVFLITGLQARVIADTLDLSQWKSLALACALVCIVIIVVRFIWVFAATYLHPAWCPPWRGTIPRRPGRASSSSPSPAFAAWCRWRRRCPFPSWRTARLSPSRPAAAGHLRGDPGDAGGPGLHPALGDPAAGHRRAWPARGR